MKDANGDVDHGKKAAAAESLTERATRRLRARVDAAMAMVGGYEDFVDALESENGALKKQLADERAAQLVALTRADARLDEVREGLEAQIAHMRRKHLGELENLQCEMEEDRRRHMQEAEELRHAHEKAKAALEADLAATRRAYEDLLQDSQRAGIKHAEALVQQERKHTSQLRTALGKALSAASTEDKGNSHTTTKESANHADPPELAREVRESDLEEADENEDERSVASVDFLYEGSQRSANSVGPTQESAAGTPQSRRSAAAVSALSSGPPTQEELVCASPPKITTPTSAAPATPPAPRRGSRPSPQSASSPATPVWSAKPTKCAEAAPTPSRAFSGPRPASRKRQRMQAREPADAAQIEAAQDEMSRGRRAGGPAADADGPARRNALVEGDKFRFVDVVRKKADRAALPGRSCPKCERFYAALAVKDPHTLQELRNECSRHRHRYTSPGTPPNYWDIPSLSSLANTQTQDSAPADKS